MPSLQRISLRLVASVVALVLMVSLASQPPTGADPAEDEAAFVAKLNALRQARGRRPLAVRQDLADWAESWATQMAERGAISHNPGLATDGPADWLRLGENVGRGASVQQLHDAFVASPRHYRNMVDSRYEVVGVGVVESDDGTMYVTMLFMTPTHRIGSAALASAGASTSTV